MSRYSQKHIALCEAAVSTHLLPDFSRFFEVNIFYRSVTDGTDNYFFYAARFVCMSYDKLESFIWIFF